ncbi:MAG TPA: hypothetical protein VFA23_10765 [Dongiaceae bacterium]|nr:hypothetical protein [Dongiaceae bacterium]
MNRTRRTIEDATDTIQEQISRLREELSDLSRSLGDNASAETRSALRSLRERFDRLADDAASRTREGVEQTRETIAHHPLTAIGIALGLGVILASILRR